MIQIVGNASMNLDLFRVYAGPGALKKGTAPSLPTHSEFLGGAKKTFHNFICRDGLIFWIICFLDRLKNENYHFENSGVVIGKIEVFFSRIRFHNSTRCCE